MQDRRALPPSGETTTVRRWRPGQRPGLRPRRPGSPAVAAVRIGLATGLLLVVLGASMAVGGTLAAVAAYQVVMREMPSEVLLPERPAFQTTQILDRHGNVLYEIFDQEGGRRTVVSLADMPRYLIDATVATEDANFFREWNLGVDPVGVLRAIKANLEAGTVVAGGSTITQQLVKNVLIPPEERYDLSLDRKLREALYAFQITRSYPKERILEMYLNEINYGNLAYGVEAAAQTYFGKHVGQLTLAEAAMLAGLPQAPAYYDPFKNPAAAKERQGQVLDLMVRHGFLDEATAEAAKAEPLQYANPNWGHLEAPHFVWYVRDWLIERYGQRALTEAGLRVYTTLDLDTQHLAEEVVSKHVATLARQDARNAALVALAPDTGEILAMVGSPDYYNASIDGQVNAALADRQPGSAIKPLVYLAAFQRGFGPATVVLDQRTEFPDTLGRRYVPQNYDRRFRGPVTLRRALGNSLNIPAVKVLQFVGVKEVVRLARSLGITSLREDYPYGLSFTLGGTEVKLLELAGAYAALANGGKPVPPDPILRIENSAGAVLYTRPAPPATPQIDPRLTFLITDILADNDARSETFGVNSPLRLSRPAAVKTGSTDDYRDSWTIGYTPSLVAGVWVGNSDGHPMRQVLGSSGAGIIWHEFMERALEGTPPEPFPVPDGLVRGTVCATTGYVAGYECSRQVQDWFLAERPPQRANAPRPRVAIDTRSNKLATPYCPLSEIAFRTFGGSVSGEGPYAPTEYCDLHGPQTGRPALPWETAPTATATATPTPVSPTPVSSRVVLGAPLTPLPTWTPSPTRTPSPTLTPLGLGSPAGRLLAVLPVLPTTTPGPEGPTPYHPWAHLPFDVRLTYPIGEVVAGDTLPVLGSASLPYFEQYAVEYGVGDVPTTWYPIGSPRRQPVSAGVLETWEVAGLPSGAYTLRLSVTDNRGQPVEVRQVVRLARATAAAALPGR